MNLDQTFDKLLGKDDLSAASQQATERRSAIRKISFVNVFEFSVTFNVQVTKAGVIVNVPVTIGKSDSADPPNASKLERFGN